MWKLIYVNSYGDLQAWYFEALDDVQIHLEACFREVGEPFGFRCKWTPKPNSAEVTHHV